MKRCRVTNRGGSDSGPTEQREVGADSGGQRKVCGPPQEPADVFQTGVASEEGAQGDRNRSRALDGVLYLDEYRVLKEGEKRLRDQLL